MDLISELPTEIKHHIIKFLPVPDTAQSRLISKAWKSAYDTRPVLYFSNNGFFGEPEFYEFLHKSLQSFVEKGVSVEIFRLIAFHMDDNDVIRRWVHFLAANTNLKELQIELCSRTYHYDLDILSSKTLTTMSLSGIRLTNRGWHFPSMKSVYLDDMILDETILGEFVSACPRLEEFYLGWCEGLARIEISGLVRLKRFSFYSLIQDGSVEVTAPSLEAFVYGGCDCFSHSEIKLGSCEGSLKELSVSNTSVSNEWLQAQISRFGDLEVLILQGIDSLTTLKISSPKLTKLILECCPNLAVDSEIYAPNLLDLKYSRNKFPYCSLVGSPLPMKVDFGFWCLMNKYDNDYTLWSRKFEELLLAASRLNNVVVSIKFHTDKIGILHDGPSDSIFRILHNFTKLVPLLDIEVGISSSDASWKKNLIEGSIRSIYVASPSLNNYLLEYLSENCGVHRNLHSVRVESLNDWTEFKGNADTMLSLLKVYNGSPFSFTRFSLLWS